MLALQSAGKAQYETERANPKPRVPDLLKITKLSAIFKGYNLGGI